MKVNITRKPIDGKKKYGKYGAWKEVVKNTKKALRSFTYDIPVTSVFLDHFLKINGIYHKQQATYPAQRIM